MALQDLVRLILPKEDHFYDLLEQQAKLAHEGAQALKKLADGDTIASVRSEVHATEKRGDKVAHEVEDALAKTFVTPIDREDIHKLSSLLDDILDRAHATASAFDMFSIGEPSESARGLMALLVRMTERLERLMPCLRKHDWAGTREGTRELKKMEKEGDEIYRGAMRGLFSDASIDARSLIREKEVIELLEDACDTCEDVAEYLTNLSVKHG
ncbi:MAG: DUF47 family protein [Polyangiaceae bacterium]|jgi:uncharacterized protein Yka (UPF0111/DUF47 family)|nr:DUF47 family protein [Polyangiaceae bacterium]MBK8937480.1 DUF47 family protein [Polyangiaceae bacterium]